MDHLFSLGLQVVILVQWRKAIVTILPSQQPGFWLDQIYKSLSIILRSLTTFWPLFRQPIISVKILLNADSVLRRGHGNTTKLYRWQLSFDIFRWKTMKVSMIDKKQVRFYACPSYGAWEILKKEHIHLRVSFEDFIRTSPGSVNYANSSLFKFINECFLIHLVHFFSS